MTIIIFLWFRNVFIFHTIKCEFQIKSISNNEMNKNIAVLWMNIGFENVFFKTKHFFSIHT